MSIRQLTFLTPPHTHTHSLRMSENGCKDLWAFTLWLQINFSKEKNLQVRNPGIMRTNSICECVCMCMCTRVLQYEYFQLEICLIFMHNLCLGELGKQSSNYVVTILLLNFKLYCSLLNFFFNNCFYSWQFLQLRKSISFNHIFEEL